MAAAPQQSSPFDLDPDLKMAFARNFQFFKRVFSVETLLTPLPYRVKAHVARQLHSFTRIFTQFFDPGGIQNAQKSLGLRREDRSQVYR